MLVNPKNGQDRDIGESSHDAFGEHVHFLHRNMYLSLLHIFEHLPLYL